MRTTSLSPYPPAPSNGISSLKGRLAVAMAGLLFLGACGSIANKRSPEKVASIEVGTSTKAEVLKILGLPNETGKAILEDGRPAETWVYYRWADRSAITVIFPGPNGTSGRATIPGALRGNGREDHAATIVFSDSGIVIEIQTPFKEVLR